MNKIKRRRAAGQKKQNLKGLPLILLILDGWGITKPSRGNAVTLAKTPTLIALAKKYPYTLLHAHGKFVGLPAGQVGNSEAGHMNIGAGRLVEQDAVKINRSITEGTFFKNVAFREAMRRVNKNHSKLHLMGMLSNGMSPHSDLSHLFALIKMARQNKVKRIYLHLFTDGRDSPQHESLRLIKGLDKVLNKDIKIATIMGRFYAMDRKKAWNRTRAAYNAMVLGDGLTAASAEKAIIESYNRDETDEYIKPYLIDKAGLIADNDSIIFFNLRSDRARQLAKVFIQKDFTKRNHGSFLRKKTLQNIYFVTMTDFGPDLDSIVTAYPSVDIKQTLPIVLNNLKQLYLAESEKFAHVTYFFNGGYAGMINGEEHFMIPSPDVYSYDRAPQMRSYELTEKVLQDLKNDRYDFTVMNFAASDMVAHTGNLKAAITCCEIIDECVAKIVDAYLRHNGTVIITADHGNIEEMINLKTGEVDTEHSVFPVPFNLINNRLKNLKLREGGSLCDIAPTILQIIGQKKPALMTGRGLLKKNKP
ncbi:MAG TPA: 2,3-bisphosphoglycerate-independent phosphoglycerate mutase [Candidatus Methylomirabilis sp.]|nr:2,3-bisphosphoglycerate-independent phosphoglycerate mutase [Candidatus Methylomirabilis sp.]